MILRPQALTATCVLIVVWGRKNLLPSYNCNPFPCPHHKLVPPKARVFQFTKAPSLGFEVTAIRLLEDTFARLGEQEALVILWVASLSCLRSTGNG